jgi:hypothetical protein
MRSSKSDASLGEYHEGVAIVDCSAATGSEASAANVVGCCCHWGKGRLLGNGCIGVIFGFTVGAVAGDPLDTDVAVALTTGAGATVVTGALLPLVRQVLNPEQAHALALKVTRRNWAPRFRPNPLEYHSQVDLSISPWKNIITSSETKEGMVFESCVGLAAGFDKDGVAVGGLMDMGFGFVEIGSVTPQPQPGNPTPRLWRLSNDLHSPAFGTLHRETGLR